MQDLYELVTVSEYIDHVLESEVVLDIHWETGKEILCKIYKSGNLPIVGTGNRNSRSRVIDCAAIYKEQEIFYF